MILKNFSLAVRTENRILNMHRGEFYIFKTLCHIFFSYEFSSIFRLSGINKALLRHQVHLMARISLRVTNTSEMRGP